MYNYYQFVLQFIKSLYYSEPSEYVTIKALIYNRVFYLYISSPQFTNNKTLNIAIFIRTSDIQPKYFGKALYVRDV